MSDHNHHDGHYGLNHGWYMYRGHRYYGYYSLPPQPQVETKITIVQPQAVSPDVGTLIVGTGILTLAAVLIYIGTRK